MGNDLYERTGRAKEHPKYEYENTGNGSYKRHEVGSEIVRINDFYRYKHVRGNLYRRIHNVLDSYQELSK